MQKPVSNLRVPTSAYTLFNLAGLCVCCWGLIGVLGRPLPEQLREGGHFQFLTNLSLCLTIATISVNIFVSGFQSQGLQFIGFTLTAAALVAETIVSLIYWTLKLFLLHMIVPANVLKENYIPLSIDMAIHLFPVFFLSIDYYFLRRSGFKLPVAWVVFVMCSLAYAYWVVLETLVVPPAHYPYPFLNVDTPERMKIFFGVGIAGFLFYHVYEYLHGVVERLLFTQKVKAL